MCWELIIYIFLILISSYFTYLSLQLPHIAGVSVGPEVWPLALLTLIVIASGAALIYRLLRGGCVSPPKLDRAGVYGVLMTMVFVATYALTFIYLGFFISTLLVFTTYLRLIGVKTTYSLVAGLIFSFLALITFPVLLLIPLPRGYGVFYDLTSYVLSIFGR